MGLPAMCAAEIMVNGLPRVFSRRENVRPAPLKITNGAK
jgi:hypothetical protein